MKPKHTPLDDGHAHLWELGSLWFYYTPTWWRWLPVILPLDWTVWGLHFGGWHFQIGWDRQPIEEVKP